jgi:hypothetical protein
MYRHSRSNGPGRCSRIATFAGTLPPRHSGSARHSRTRLLHRSPVPKGGRAVPLSRRLPRSPLRPLHTLPQAIDPRAVSVMRLRAGRTALSATEYLVKEHGKASIRTFLELMARTAASRTRSRLRSGKPLEKSNPLLLDDIPRPRESKGRVVVLSPAQGSVTDRGKAKDPNLGHFRGNHKRLEALSRKAGLDLPGGG